MAIGIADPAGTGDVQIMPAGKPAKLMGWSAVESAGAPALATAVIRNGSTTSDPPVAVIGLLASTSQAERFGPQGIECPNGIFLDRVTGNTTFVVYVQ